MSALGDFSSLFNFCSFVSGNSLCSSLVLVLPLVSQAPKPSLHFFQISLLHLHEQVVRMAQFEKTTSETGRASGLTWRSSYLLVVSSVLALQTL